MNDRSNRSVSDLLSAHYASVGWGWKRDCISRNSVGRISALDRGIRFFSRLGSDNACPCRRHPPTRCLSPMWLWHPLPEIPRRRLAVNPGEAYAQFAVRGRVTAPESLTAEACRPSTLFRSSTLQSDPQCAAPEREAARWSSRPRTPR